MAIPFCARYGSLHGEEGFFAVCPFFLTLNSLSPSVVFAKLRRIFEFLLRVQVDVAHPAAKTMIELSRSQDEETGDGSTSVVVLAGEVLSCSVDLLEKQQLHPSVISHGYMRALEDALAFLDEMAETVDIDKDESVLRIVDACVGTKFASRWRGLLSKMAVDAVRRVTCTLPSGQKVIDIK